MPASLPPAAEQDPPQQSGAVALTSRLFREIDVSSLVVFRIAFGALLLWEVVRYFDHGWIRRYWIEPELHFTYFGFGWVGPWPGEGMYLHMLALGVVALAIIVGFRYRIAMLLTFVGFTYLFLLEQARYLNHFYLICLLAFLMVLVPAHRAFSLDAARRPASRRGTAPAWSLGILRVQMGVVYFYGGVAKLNGDWLRGEPMRMWLGARTDYPLVGWLFDGGWVVYLFSYGGLLLDLLVVPALLWPRSRPYAFAVVVAFHLTNAWIFQIGVFPWLAIAATTLFFPPDWPRRVFRRWGVVLGDEREGRYRPGSPPPSRLGRLDRAIVAGLAIYVAAQLLVPLRHWLYPGDVAWTEEGHRFAWRMKLRDKEANVVFQVKDPTTGDAWHVRPRELLEGWQASKMASRPDMILQLAHILAAEERAAGHQAEVRVRAVASLNGRPPQSFIDPTVDLGAEPRTLWPASWILPLEHPLPVSRP